MTPRRPLAPALASAALAALLGGCGGAPPPGSEAVPPIEAAEDDAPVSAAMIADEAPTQAASDARDTPQQKDASAGDRGDAATQVADAPSRLAAHLAKIDPSIQPGLAELLAERPQEGNVWAGKLAGNGGRDVLIYIPPGADDARPFRLIYHFHGTNSEHVQRKAPGVAKTEWVGWNRLEQTLEGARALQDQVPENVALV
ncbi:MAG: hypothetical protein KC420_04230, partial [Myxococcales bacterium]|nr:hypothetical protein [Myxococcales bacterium]